MKKIPLVKVEINSKVNCEVEKSFFEKVAVLTIQKTLEQIKLEKKQEINISVALVSDEEIKSLNKQWRNKEEVTDVLSFSEKDASINQNIYPRTVFLGEIILGCDFIKKSAIMKNRNKKEELAEVFSHGILHLLGYSHGKKMFSLQKEICHQAIKNNL